MEAGVAGKLTTGNIERNVLAAIRVDVRFQT